MNNITDNRTSGVEYSELYRNLRKEVSEENTRTARLPEKTHADSDKKAGDKVELNTNAPVVASEVGKLTQQDAQATLSYLLGAIKQDPSSAYEAQNNLLASRIAVLLDS
jgi:uncharacterized UBP type Zn finger protein